MVTIGTSEASFSVHINRGGPEYSMAGTLTRPTGQEKAIQILIPGGAYDRSYWDFPYQPETYSYVRHMAERGLATLAIDPLGRGKSDRPPAETVTFDGQAHAIHDVVQQLRDPDGPYRFEKVIICTHSLGSIIGVMEASRYADIDGLILTGHLRCYGAFDNPDVDPKHMTTPATADPVLQSAGYAEGYGTTHAGTRGIFYYFDRLDPAVLEADEQNKSVLAAGEIAQFRQVLANRGPYLGVLVPLLIVIGRYDNICCGGDCSNAQDEHNLYGAHTEMEIMLVEDSGHNLNLQTNAPEMFDRLYEYLKRRHLM